MSLLKYILILVCSVKLLGQVTGTKTQRLEAYKKSIDAYLPTDWKTYRLMILVLDHKEIVERLRQANYASYAQNGIDTTLNPAPFSESELESHRKMANNPKAGFGAKEIKKLRRYQPIYLKVSDLSEYNKTEFRYYIDTGFTSDKASPEDQGFVITLDYFFVDRITGQKYKMISDKSLDVIDLMH
ncbi:MAG: hypothetical protein KF803_11870 [Cyclobacteriaceae bacterium]|nr:hypothetical protein [Cyclobacteriaceae bacterium]